MSSSMQDAHSRPSFFVPIELIHRILTDVVGSSIHVICTSVEEVHPSSWHFMAIATLYSVSFSFQEIMREVLLKTFAIQGEKRQ